MKNISIYAPKEQQIEGLKSVLENVSFDSFLSAVEKLTASKMLSKSHKIRLIEYARHILGISFTDYLRKHKPFIPRYNSEEWNARSSDNSAWRW